MSSFSCKFCNKSFASKSNLNTHVKNAYYCKQNRPKIDSENETENNLKNNICQYCKKECSSKKRLEEHFKNCLEFNLIQREKSYQNIIDDLKNELKQKELLLITNAEQNKKQSESIIELQKTITYLAEKAISKDTKTTNHTTNIQDNSKKYLNVQSLDLSKERIDNLVGENLTLKHVEMGKKGITHFITEVVGQLDGKAIVWSSDKARNTINFIDDEGNLVKDVGGLIILTNTVPSIESQAKKILSHYQKTFYNEDMTLKSLEEIKEEEDDEEEDFQRYLQEKKEREKQKMNPKVENEINYIKEKYDEERIGFHFNRACDGFLGISEVKEDPNLISKNLSISLPDKPNRITKFDWDNDSVRDPRFKYDPKKILA